MKKKQARTLLLLIHAHKMRQANFEMSVFFKLISTTFYHRFPASDTKNMHPCPKRQNESLSHCSYPYISTIEKRGPKKNPLKSTVS